MASEADTSAQPVPPPPSEKDEPSVSTPGVPPPPSEKDEPSVSTPGEEGPAAEAKETGDTGLLDSWDQYMDRMLSRIPGLGAPSPGDLNPGSVLHKTLALDSFAKHTDILQSADGEGPCFTTDLTTWERADWCEELHRRMEELGLKGCLQAEVTDGERMQAVEPYLKSINSFRDFLVKQQYQEASGVVDELLNDTGLTKYRRDVLASLFRISRKAFFDWRGKDQAGDRSELVDLHTRLVQELKKVQVKPSTIGEAFQQNDWAAMKPLYRAHKDTLSKMQLNQVVVLAARVRDWAVFTECLELGADAVQKEKDTILSTAQRDTSRPTSDSKADDGDGPTDTKRRKMTEPVVQLSPLHEALKTGEFLLRSMEPAFQENLKLVSAVDDTGDSLLHLAVAHGEPDIVMKNVRFLIDHKVDVNAQDAAGKAALQYLMHPSFKPWEVDMVVELVTAATLIATPTWHPGVHQWTALHMLCASGLHQHLLHFVQKGAYPRELRQGLTLIDTVILQDSTPQHVKRKTLATLLEDPLNLGPYHAGVVKERASSDTELRKYQRYLVCAKNYLYPLERLVFPLMSTHTVRLEYAQFVKMLLDAGAVCPEELKHVADKLHLADQEYSELGEYMQRKK